MADAPKVLGQVDLAATTLTAVYTVPASTATVVSSLFVCNRTAGALTFRVSVSKAGAADNVKQYLYYDLPIPANETFTSTTGLSLATTDVVRAYASGAGVSVQLFGVEVT